MLARGPPSDRSKARRGAQAFATAAVPAMVANREVELEDWFLVL